MNNFSKYYGEVSRLLKLFSRTLDIDNISKEDEPFASYNLTLIILLSETTSSISTLLKKKIYASVAPLLRIIIEGFFSLNWVTEVKESKNEMNDRIFCLEAYPSFLYEIELEKMEEDLKSKNPSWKPEAVKIIRDAIEKDKLNNPSLTEINKGKVCFKSAPGMTKRMSENRAKYYHLYSFTSFLSHPGPGMKILFLNKYKNDLAISFYEPLAKTMIQCMQFIIGILGNAVNIFNEFDGNDRRRKILDKIKQVTLNAIKYYREEYKREPI